VDCGRDFSNSPNAHAHWVLLLAVLFLRPVGYWVIWTVGRYWTHRVNTLPSAAILKRGPCRILSHPNYLVTLEELHSRATRAVYYIPGSRQDDRSALPFVRARYGAHRIRSRRRRELLMPRAKKTLDVPTDRLDEMPVRLKLLGIRDQLDKLLDEASRSNLSTRETLSDAVRARDRAEGPSPHRHGAEARTLPGLRLRGANLAGPKQIRDLAASRWIGEGENVLLLGGDKTHLAVALGREAILAGYSVQFTTAVALVAGGLGARREASRRKATGALQGEASDRRRARLPAA
jgi:hypothetical protein